MPYGYMVLCHLPEIIIKAVVCCLEVYTPFVICLTTKLLYLKLSLDVCQQEGAECDKTVFNRCCGNLTCVLTGFAKGTCEQCAPKGQLCWLGSTCCSGDCAWYRLCKWNGTPCFNRHIYHTYVIGCCFGVEKFIVDVSSNLSFLVRKLGCSLVRDRSLACAFTQARRSCANLQGTFNQGFLHDAFLKNLYPEVGFRLPFSMVPTSSAGLHTIWRKEKGESAEITRFFWQATPVC